MRALEQLGEAFEHLVQGRCHWQGELSRGLRVRRSDAGHAGRTEAKEVGGVEAWILSRGQSELHELALEYTWEEVTNATFGFATSRVLGSGASGAVYQGTLPEGTEVAVKVIHAQVHGGFEDEVRLLSRCRHPNVVMLLGFSQHPEERQSAAFWKLSQRAASHTALVYEFLPGGDLHARLQKQPPPFLWRSRMQTAIDVARGLAHLHRHRPEIFHRDVKSQNILFGSDGTARIADFGLACVPTRRDARHLATPNVAGTVGYADPLYARTGVVTEASEIYSFGMVVLELLTGCPPAVLAPDGKMCTFLSDELRPWDDDAKFRVLRRLDKRGHWPLATSGGLATLALLCIHEDVNRRPSFLEVATMLQDLLDIAVATEAASASISTSAGVSVGNAIATHQRVSCVRGSPRSPEVLYRTVAANTAGPCAEYGRIANQEYQYVRTHGETIIRAQLPGIAGAQVVHRAMGRSSSAQPPPPPPAPSHTPSPSLLPPARRIGNEHYWVQTPPGHACMGQSVMAMPTLPPHCDSRAALTARVSARPSPCPYAMAPHVERAIPIRPEVLAEEALDQVAPALLVSPRNPEDLNQQKLVIAR